MPRLKPMAFHVACPITCRLICDCELGFPEELRSPRARREFEEQGERLEEFLKDPWLVRAGSGGGGGGTVQVLVPKVVPTPAPPLPPSTSVDHGGGGDDALSSAHVRWAALQRQAVAASMAAEDYVRRLEAGGAAEVPGEAANTLVTEDQCSSIKVMCRICFSGESEGSERAMKMLPCKFCHKKYHRSCLKVWAEHRDLFHWSSWACPSCRICEICRRVGDPTKLMFCKRCDGAYHCYCQQPPHKNVSHGPYLCPKHTRCHSCGSTVPGSGLSTRWFLGYTCCDACGRLFVKGKYCPVCLKVYRDSEMTPMVCCDVCQQWVHCVCDGISDEKYQQFQADGNLYYKCLACRRDCYQVKDMEDAVRELWRRRDKADRDLTASLRAAAGLPTQEEIFSICPYSDDEETSPVIPKNDYGRSSKISVKSLTDKASKNSKEHRINFSKRSSSKKYTSKGHQVQFSGKSEEPYRHNERQHVVRSPESSLRDPKFDETKPYRNDAQAYFSSPLTRSLGNDKGKSSFDQMGSNNQMFIEEGVGNNSDKMPKVHIKCSKSPGLHVKEGVGKESSKTETVKGTKLVIHFGAKNRNAPPKSDASSFHKDQDVNASKGSEGMSELVMKESKNYVVDSHPVIARNHDGKGAKLENSTQIKSSRHGDREDSVIKLRKISETHRKRRANIAECEPMTACRSPLIIRKTSTEVDPAIKTRSQTTWTHNDDLPGKNSLNTTVNLQSEIHNVAESPFTSKSSDDPKPLLKLKFKNPFFEHRNSWAPSEGAEKNPVKGQRSKRKRPLFHKENNQVDDNKAQPNQEDPIDEVGDANWILQKLGKDAIGKSRSS